MKSRRGIALATTMIMVGILAMLTAAFFEAYRSHFALTRSTNATQAAAFGCDAVYEYVVYRIEHDRTWGAVEFPKDGSADMSSPILTAKAFPGTYVFSGEIEDLGVEFTATIHNNLSGGAAHEISAKAEAGTAYCSVTSSCGTSTRRAEFKIQVAPLFDSSVLTRADVKVGAQTLTMRSLDPDRNMLRAEGDITVPDILTDDRSQFLTTAGDADERGLLWAKGDIYSLTDELVPADKIATDEQVAAARRNSHGKIVSQAESHFSIYDLKEADLQLPDDATRVVLPNGGRWNFVRRLATVNFSAQYNDADDGLFDSAHTGNVPGTKDMWIDVLEYYKNPGDPVPTEVYRGGERIEDIIDSVPTTADVGGDSGDIGLLDPASIKVDSFQIDSYNQLATQHGVTTPTTEVVEGDAKTYGVHGEVRFDLTKQRVTVNKEATVDIRGPFHLTSETAEGAPTDTPPPVLDLGYSVDPNSVGGVAKASIVAEGTINIKNGVTQGLGRLVSRRGDVKIQPKNTASVKVDTTSDGSGLLVFAGGNVELTNPGLSKDWTFKGLVYARQGIKMNGGGAARAKFEGTIVALQHDAPANPGDPNGIEFEHCQDVEFIYNSDILDAYVRNLPGGRIQVESVYWKR